MTTHPALRSAPWVIKKFFSEHSGSKFSHSRCAIAHCAAAVPSSLIVAEFAPQRWLFPYLPPIPAAQMAAASSR